MSDMTNELIADAGERMHKSVEATRNEFGSVRTGRASPALLDRIVVDYYGAQTPLKQLATIHATEARLLTVQPYDKGSIKAIEKAIMESDVGLTPNNDGQLIRLQIPDLTAERRRDMVKVVHGVGEEGRIAIRNVRRDVISDLRVMDSTALSLCMDNDLPIYVFNVGDESNIDRIVSGEKVGTLVGSEPAK